jgi:hypothetical protein
MKKKRIVALSALAVFAVLAAVPVVSLYLVVRSSENFVQNQVSAAVRYLPGALVSSFFKPLTSDEVDMTKQKAGGFMMRCCAISGALPASR